MLRIRLFIALTVLLGNTCFAQTLPLPPRATNTISSTDFIRQIEPLALVEREQTTASEILRGNVPASLTNLYAVNLTNITNGQTNTATIFVTRDYLSIGTDTDHFLTPLTPATAQHIADELGCMLPTRKMVDAIYAAAQIKLDPQPIVPTTAMTTVPVFAAHNEIIRTQLVALSKARISTALIAGHKKDVVISAKLAALTNRVAIYGWHRTNGVAIQPLYTGHRADWADYSHGIRLVSQTMLLNGQPTNITAILSNTNLCQLLSDECVITQPRYPTNYLSPAVTASLGWPLGFRTSKYFGELTGEFNLPNNVRVIINTPPFSSFATNKPVQLIFFALPNGNTIEQTIGKQMQPGDDWHFNIQHIGAQTRFLRNVLTNQTIVVAYLENSLKSWTAWRRANGNDGIPALFNAVRHLFADYRQEIVLTGHSGGGSLTFGYLNAVPEIPRDIKRIAFLDSNYAYETTNHFTKLANWLKQTDEFESPVTNRSVPVPGHSSVVRPISSEQFQAARNLNVSAPEDGRTPPGEGSAHYLCVLAYHDSIALLDGKTFVSERGGTWGRSHAMLADLQTEFPFTSHTNSAGLRSHLGADGRIQFLLKENPEKKILHTVQVERNGFIHALLTGTPLENRGYEYFGERAYAKWIHGD